jgi:hypothetical protein
LFAGDHRRCFDRVIGAGFIQRWDYLVANACRRIRVRSATDNRVKGQLRSGADDGFQLRRRPNARHLDQDPIRALALNGRLTGADLINPATHDFQRLAHGAIIGGEFFRLGEFHGDYITLPRYVDVIAAGARQAGDRIGKAAHQLQRARHAFGFGDLQANLPLGRLLTAKAANRGAFGPQCIAHLGPKRIHAGSVNLLDLHFGQKMCTTAQIETKIDQRGRQIAGPLRDQGLSFGGVALGDNFGGSIVRLLNPGVKPIWQGKQKAGHADQPDENPFPEINLKHCPAFSVC